MATNAVPMIDAEYRAMREGAGVLHRSERGALDLAGPDAVAYLQAQVTNDVDGLSPSVGCYAALLNPKGKILADMRVIPRSPQEVLLDTEPTGYEALRSGLDMYKIGRDVTLAERPERAIVSLIGPRARETAGVDVPFEEHAFAEAVVGGIPVLAVATDVGIDLLVDGAPADALRERLIERGATPIGPDAAEVVRIESGRPRHGVDMTDDNLPGEVGIEDRAVSFTKGCYVGQEPVARMHWRGHPNRHLRGLELSGPASPGEAVQSEDKEVGRVTSTCLSPQLGPIALALVRREVAPGRSVTVGGERAATVVELPFAIGYGRLG